MDNGGATPDRIDVAVSVGAGLDRVWEAVSDSGNFGAWFMARLDSPFTPGATTRGHVTYPGFEHIGVEIQVVEIAAPTLFTFRWHPYAIDPAVDYSGERTTLVEFGLAHNGTGRTMVTITETGFLDLPEARRAEAYAMHQGGWSEQTGNLKRFVELAE